MAEVRRVLKRAALPVEAKRYVRRHVARVVLSLRGRAQAAEARAELVSSFRDVAVSERDDALMQASAAAERAHRAEQELDAAAERAHRLSRELEAADLRAAALQRELESLRELGRYVDERARGARDAAEELAAERAAQDAADRSREDES
jgi:chromosome segregation ATPase